jgi:isopenicillin-N epimerase
VSQSVRGAVPAFGRSWRGEWMLEEGATYLNHGTVGSPPRRVLAAQQAIRDEIERHPSRFLLRELAEVRVGGPRAEPPRVRVAAAEVAARFGVPGDELVFVDNTTSGVNAVLRSFPFAPGDEILLTDLGYGAMGNIARFVARRRGATVREAVVPFPGATPAGALAAIEAALGPATRLALIDHITSESALLLPIVEIAALCRERGVALLVDGAHAPGAIELDIPAIGADYYVANLHKWAWTPRPCGILWAAPARRGDLHPAEISWGLDQGWTTEFDLLGTRDPSAWLAAPAALDYLEEVGAAAVREWNHRLAWDGAHHLAERWQVELDTPRTMIGPMATLPLPDRFGGTREDAARLRDALLFEDAIEAQIHARDGRLWTRVAAQVYNDMDDFDRFGEAIERRLHPGAGTG